MKMSKEAVESRRDDEPQLFIRFQATVLLHWARTQEPVYIISSSGISRAAVRHYPVPVLVGNVAFEQLALHVEGFGNKIL